LLEAEDHNSCQVLGQLVVKAQSNSLQPESLDEKAWSNRAVALRNWNCEPLGLPFWPKALALRGWDCRRWKSFCSPA
jgi:hypothetical protein